MTIKERLLELGMRETEIDFHETDLYVLKNKISEGFIKTYEYRDNVKTFRSAIDGKLWYELPSAYIEFRR